MAFFIRELMRML